MIRGKDQKRVIRNLKPVQRFHDFAHTVIHHRDLRIEIAQGAKVIGRAHQHGEIQMLGRIRGAQHIPIYRRLAQPLARNRIHRAIRITRCVAVLICFFGRRPMPIRRGIREVEKERRFSLGLLFDKFDTFVGEEID